MEDIATESTTIDTSSEDSSSLDTVTTDAGSTQPTETVATKAAAGLKSLDSATAPEVKPVWAPDWKYKFDGKEKELDEFWRPLAKDEAALAKVKDFVQRAEAVEMHKQKLYDYEKQMSDTKPIVEKVNKLQDLYAKEEHERVLSELGYDDELLFKIVKEKLKRLQMPEDQRVLWEEKQRLALEKEKIMSENEQYRSQAMQELARVTDYEMDTELGKAEYQSLKAAYDGVHGDGAFKQLVIDRGAYLVDKAGKHVPPSEVVQNVAKEFAPFLKQQAQAAGAAGVQGQAKPKVIPNVGKGSGSPARAAVTSLAQLKQLSKQFQ